MGILMQNDSLVGGIDSSLVNKIGTAPLDTVAQDLSGAVNELKATGGGGNVDDVYVNGVSVLDSNKIAQIDLTGKVNKTGDTMTGNLTIENQTNGSVQIINPNTDLREADNNISNAQFNQFRIVDDGSHMTMGYFGTTVYPEGLVQGTLQVSNFDTNGDPVSNSITLTVDKDGNKSYNVSDGAAFRRAIGVLNRAAANAGADLSLVTTGDKYNWNDKVAKSGDTMTGRLVMVGSASSQPIQTRAVVGSSVDGSALDALHLQYGNTVNDSVAFGNTAGGSITDNGTKYSGASALMQVPRVAKSCNYQPGKNLITVEEYTSGANYNLPSNAWYHIYTSEGSDANYTCQLALGMTTDAAYYRRYSGSWGSWHSLINSNTTYSAGTGISLSGTTFSNSGVRSISTGSSNGTISVNTNGTSANVSVKGLGSAAYSNTSAFAAASHTHSYLPLSGGTLTGDVTISKAYPITVQKNTAVTYGTSSNNGVSSNTYCCRAIRDKNNNEYASWNTGAYTDGHFESYIVVYNKQTNGTGVSNDLCIGIRKNGTKYYSVKGPSEFRSAIGAAASSSRAYKENIKDITNEEALKLLNINICSFDYKKGFSEEGKEKGHFGVIAEDVVKIIPSAVNIPEYYKEEEVDPKLGTKQALISVDYWKFIPHLIKLVQMQQKEIEELKEKVK